MLHKQNNLWSFNLFRSGVTTFLIKLKLFLMQSQKNLNLYYIISTYPVYCNVYCNLKSILLKLHYDSFELKQTNKKQQTRSLNLILKKKKYIVTSSTEGDKSLGHQFISFETTVKQELMNLCIKFMSWISTKCNSYNFK